MKASGKIAALLAVLGLYLPSYGEILIYKFSETDTYFQQNGGEWQVRKEANRGYVFFEVDYADNTITQGEAIGYGKGAAGKWFQSTPADLELVRVDSGGQVQWVLMEKQIESAAEDAVRGQFVMAAGRARNRNIGVGENREVAGTLAGYILEDADRDAGRSIQMSKLTLTLYPSWTSWANGDGPDEGHQDFDATRQRIKEYLIDKGYTEETE
jgi:hypothetical protein